MTGEEYRRWTLDQMQHCRWRTTRTMSNGNMEIPAGRVVEIVGKRSGLTLKGSPCETCGIRLFITRVSPGDVERID